MTPALRVALIGIAVGSLLIPLNSTMLAVALPSVIDEFGVGPQGASLLVTVYLGVMALSMPVSGGISDRIGHRRTFLIGVAAFAATSLIGAVSRAFPLLVAARALQAMSGSLISPSSSALVRAISPPERRGASFGFFDMLISVSAAVGPLIGGLLVGAFGWRSLFVMAVPVSGAATLLVASRVPTDAGSHPAPQARARGLGAAMRSLPFLSALLGVFGVTVVLHGTFLVIPITTQSLLGASAQASGAVLLAIAGLAALVTPFGGRTSDRLGRRLPSVAGSVLIALAAAGLWASSGEAGLASITALLAVVGVGLGIGGSPRHTAAIESVPQSVAGRAAGAYFTSRYVGGAAGAAIAGAMLGETATFARAGAVFSLFAFVALAVAVVSLALPGRAAIPGRLIEVDEPISADLPE